MIRYFSKIAFRYLWHNKAYSILNYICLSFGFMCSVLVVLYVINAFSYDKFNKNYNRLYSVEALVTYFNGDRFPKQYLSASLPELLKKNAPEIKDITRVSERRSTFVRAEQTFDFDGIYADDNFFEVFTFPFIAGSFRQAGSEADPNSIVISEPMAVRFFGSIDCIGETLVLKAEDRQQPFKISGVFSKVPGRSTLQFDFVIPFSRFLSDNPWAYETGASSNYTWVVLDEFNNKESANSKIKSLISGNETSLNQELFLFPLKDKELYRYPGGIRTWGEMQRVVIVAAVGLVILLIACFNFINLAVAMNIRRYRETGIKKVVGSQKSIIINQFLGETFILVIISMLTAIFLVQLVLPIVNAVTGYEIRYQWNSPGLYLIVAGMAVFTALISGIIPATYLASSRPAVVLKGGKFTSHSYSAFRQGMIIFQFTIPVALIICMLIIKTQDSFMRNYDLGVDRDRLIILKNSEQLQKHAESFRADVLNLPGITGISYTNCIPAHNAKVSNDVGWEGKETTEKLHFWVINTDFDYNKVVDLHLTEGRFFDPMMPSDSGSYLINDVAANAMKLKNAIGASITAEGAKGTVIGVFNQFHAIDLSGPYVPVIIRIEPADRPFILIRFSNKNFSELSPLIYSVYRRYVTEESFEPVLYKNYNSYPNLTLPSSLMGIAFIIALLLACMGLYGLASFTSESRTKEIGIRKTHGAKTFTIMRMLTANYFKWLVLSTIFALPVAFLFGKGFLARFNFREEFPVWTFIAGPAIAFIVAILTVSIHIWTVAHRNPVDALRTE